MKSIIKIFAFIFLVPTVLSQDVVLVKDSIMAEYMENGYANKHFKGKSKPKKNKDGSFSSIEHKVMNGAIAYTDIGKTKLAEGHYLVRLEGIYVNDKMTGIWKYYVLEDKSFKKILFQEINYELGIKSGSSKTFYISGKKSSEGIYINDKIEGEFKEFFESGELLCLSNYKNNLKEGQVKTYFKNGVLNLESTCVNDTLEGMQTSYYPDGKKAEMLFFKKGKADGVYQYYHENGQLWVERIYKDGRLMNITGSYDETGKEKEKGSLIDGNGTVYYYTTEGELYMITSFKDGLELVDKKMTDSKVEFKDRD